MNKKNNEIKKQFFEISKKLNNKTFLFVRECKENGDLYGTIKPKEVTNLIKEKNERFSKPSQVNLKDELNKIGLFNAEIIFHPEVKAKISIKIDKISSK